MEEPKQIIEPIKSEELKKLNLLEYTTIIYALLTFLTYSFTDIYYSQWGIEIYSFLDASEIYLSFLKNTNILVAILIGSFLNVMCSIYFSHIKDISPNNNQIVFKTLKFLGIKQLIVIIVLLVVIYSFDRNLNALIFWSFIVFIAYAIKSIYLTIPDILITYNKTLTSYHLIAMIFIYAFLINIICSNYKYYNVKDKVTITYFSFTNESTTYKSNDTLLYIGATSKYIFIRNTKDSTNLIFDKANIKNLSITEKRNTNK